MSIDRNRRTTFEETAALFNEARPGYPAQLVDDVLALAGIPPDGRILEIGCGPGNATLPYATRGYHITAVELGPQLAALAACNLAPFPRVQVVNVAFEEWPLAANAFDLVISAEAMHWIPPEIGYAKTAAALKESGSAAFYWNVTPDPQTEWSRAIEAVYHELELRNPDNTVTADWLTGAITENFRASGSFGAVSVRQYAWSETYTAERYVKLLQTYSAHRDLAADTRERLFTGVRTAIQQHGGQVLKPYLTMLFQARVK
ncbi:MAG TPA: class I SAM-dependent methyltransferase [Chloroflexota bacterium]|nr:class I SAM-dependent methyltransferase [Chloroflexota bacterium]HUM67503.1 class I SAM-dependent methyltransferase [Chloroflexota bacterium]